MTKTLLAPLAVIGCAAISTAGLAAALSKSGEIKSTDTAKHELVLASGETFEVGGKVKLDKLKAGEKVTISYEMKDGKMIASKVLPAK